MQTLILAPIIPNSSASHRCRDINVDNATEPKPNDKITLPGALTANDVKRFRSPMAFVSFLANISGYRFISVLSPQLDPSIHEKLQQELDYTLMEIMGYYLVESGRSVPLYETSTLLISSSLSSRSQPR